MPVHKWYLVFLGEILQAGIDALDGGVNAVAIGGVGKDRRGDGWGCPRVKQGRQHDGYTSRADGNERSLDIGKRLVHVSLNLGGRPRV